MLLKTYALNQPCQTSNSFPMSDIVRCQTIQVSYTKAQGSNSVFSLSQPYPSKPSDGIPHSVCLSKGDTQKWLEVPFSFPNQLTKQGTLQKDRVHWKKHTLTNQPPNRVPCKNTHTHTHPFGDLRTPLPRHTAADLPTWSSKPRNLPTYPREPDSVPGAAGTRAPGAAPSRPAASASPGPLPRGPDGIAHGRVGVGSAKAVSGSGGANPRRHPANEAPPKGIVWPKSPRGKQKETKRGRSL